MYRGAAVGVGVGWGSRWDVQAVFGVTTAIKDNMGSNTTRNLSW